MKTLLTNGNIYTGNNQQPWADTLVFEEERVTFVGASCDAPAVDISYDLKGKTVIPGIIDRGC